MRGLFGSRKLAGQGSLSVNRQVNNASVLVKIHQRQLHDSTQGQFTPELIGHVTLRCCDEHVSLIFIHTAHKCAR